MRQLRQHELPPEAVMQFIPIAASDRMRPLSLPMRWLTKHTALRAIIPMQPMPGEETLDYRPIGLHVLLLLPLILPIHLRGEVAIRPFIELGHGQRLRRIQQVLSEGLVHLGTARQTQIRLRATGHALPQQSIRRQPLRRGTRVHILAKAVINGIVVLGDVAIDIIEPAVPHLHVDLAPEEQRQEAHEFRYDSGASSPSETGQKHKADTPARNVPMRSAPALILRAHDPFLDNDEFMPVPADQKLPYTPHQIEHVERHEAGSSEDALEVRFPKIRPEELPLRRCDRDEDVRKRTEPDLAAHVTDVLIPRGTAQTLLPICLAAISVRR